MTAHEPPALAVAILDWVASDNDPLVGDLLEAGRMRSHAWLWFQVALAVAMRGSAELREHTRVAAETLLLGAALLALLGFHAVVAASLLNLMRQMHDPGDITSATGRYHAWQGAGAAVAFLGAMAIGRAIGRFHRDYRVGAAVTFGASAVAAAYLNLYLFVPQTALQPAFMPAGAAAQIGESMLFIAGLFIGIATSPAQIRSGMLATVACLLGTALWQPPLHAQDASERTFDVASIKRNVSNTVRGSGLAAPQPGGRYIGVGVTLRRLIGDAYDLDVEGGPDWIASDRFDINAKAAGDPTAAQIRRMLRPLLAERFKLQVHTDAREMAVFDLRFARSDGRLGDGIKESEVTCAEEARNFFPGTSPGFPPPCGDYRLGAGTFVARGLTMTGLVRVLSGITGRPVINRTDREGVFDLELKWSSDGGLTGIPRDAAGADTVRADGLTLFTALREQLGLRLDSGRAAVPVLVVDHAEPPTPD